MARALLVEELAGPVRALNILHLISCAFSIVVAIGYTLLAIPFDVDGYSAVIMVVAFVASALITVAFYVGADRALKRVNRFISVETYVHAAKRLLTDHKTASTGVTIATTSTVTQIRK